MAKRGRPRVVDEGMKKMIVALVAAGCSQREAARRAGCAASSINRVAGQDAEFAERLRKAHQEKQVSRLTRFRSLSRRSWRAAAWYLQRQWPDRFGARPPNVMSIKRVGLLMVHVFQLIVDEVPDVALRKRLLAGLARLVYELVPPVTNRRGIGLRTMKHLVRSNINDQRAANRREAERMARETVLPATTALTPALSQKERRQEAIK